MTRSLKGFTGDLRGRLEALEQVTRQARQSTTAAVQGEGFVSSHRGRVANVLQFYSAGRVGGHFGCAANFWRMRVIG